MTSRRRWLLGLCLLLAAFAFHRFGSEIAEPLRRAVTLVAELGGVGFLLFFLLYVASSLLLFPASAMTLAAGAVWGFGAGFLLVWVSASAAAAAAFLAGRHGARGWVSRKLEGNPAFGTVDRAVARDGVKIVLLTRLSPVFPFVMLNYAFGLTRIGFWGYLGATAVGMLPGTLAYVYLGTLAGDVARAAATTGESTPAWMWGLRLAGLAATLAVAWIAGKIAKEALAKEA